MGDENSRAEVPSDVLAMSVDVAGRVRNTSVPVTRPFIPMFEAVVNSIQATTKRFGDRVQEKGKIEVLIQREAASEQQEAQLGAPGRTPIPSIRSISVTDNGHGFTDSDLVSFKTADSTAKAKIGGKGVGRFTWLVVFNEASIDSVVDCGEAGLERRVFAFRAKDGIGDYGAEPTDRPIQTTVTLHAPTLRYAEHLRMGAQAIAERLFEHCFNYLILGGCPAISVRDDDLDECLDLNHRLQEESWDQPEPLDIGSHKLSVLHVRRPASRGDKHTIHLCGHHRVVESHSLSKHSELGADPYEHDGQRVFHHVFITGDSLDNAVVSNRAHLDLPSGLPVLEEAGHLDLMTVRRRVGEQVNARLAKALAEERKSNFARVSKHIKCEQPEYRHLLQRRRESLERLAWTEDKNKLDESLYRVQQEWEAEVRERQRSVEDRIADAEVNPDELAEQLAKIIMEVNEQGQANLVRYVAKRRAVLKTLGRMIGKQALEEQIHRVVFPLRTTVDELRYDDHNLWLVDDALSFYEFVSSDVPFSKLEEAPTDSKRRPDILAFKTGEPFQHVVMVEFKRPDRNDNPVQQLVDYALLLRDGGEPDVNGATMPGVPLSVRIDAYGICTLTPEMKDKIRHGPGSMRFVEHENRYYGFWPDDNLWVEVLDLKTFLRRAKERNQAFFAKLGLS